MRDVKQKIVHSLRPPNINLSHFFLPLKFAELYNYSPLNNCVRCVTHLSEIDIVDGEAPKIT